VARAANWGGCSIGLHLPRPFWRQKVKRGNFSKDVLLGLAEPASESLRADVFGRTPAVRLHADHLNLNPSKLKPSMMWRGRCQTISLDLALGRR
jgi:hypothetical protein